MNQDRANRKAAGFPTEGLSDSKIEELNRIREAIMERARQTVDPEGTGFDAVMMASDDGSFFNTDEEDPRDWMNWLINVISLASQRVSLAVASAGFAIAGSVMAGNDRTAGWGQAGLAVAVIFAVWLVAVNVMRPKSGR